MILYVTRGATFEFYNSESVTLDPNTTELTIPAGLNIVGGAIPDHVHHFTYRDERPDEQVAVWRTRAACRWCKAGY